MTSEKSVQVIPNIFDSICYHVKLFIAIDILTVRLNNSSGSQSNPESKYRTDYTGYSGFDGWIMMGDALISGDIFEFLGDLYDNWIKEVEAMDNQMM